MEGSWHDTPAEISQRVSEAGNDWADKEAAANLFEESRRSLRAQIAVRHLPDAGSVAKAELLAEASEEYRNHITQMVEARRIANRAKVNYDSGRIWSDLVRTHEATKRAEMQLR